MGKVGIGLLYGWYYSAFLSFSQLNATALELLIGLGFVASFLLAMSSRASSCSYRGFGVAEGVGVVCSLLSFVGFSPFAPDLECLKSVIAAIAAILLPIVFSRQIQSMVGMSAQEVSLAIIASLALARSVNFLAQSSPVLAWAATSIIPLLLAWACFRIGLEPAEIPSSASLIRRADGSYAQWETKAAIIFYRSSFDANSCGIEVCCKSRLPFGARPFPGHECNCRSGGRTNAYGVLARPQSF